MSLGGASLFGLYRYVQPRKGMVWSYFGLKKDIDFDHSEIGYVSPTSTVRHWVFSVLETFSRGSGGTSRNFRRFLYCL